MSTFRPSAAIPTHLLALRAKVRKNPGLHINFPYGIRYPPPGTISGQYWKTSIPEPFFVGWTMRGFFYVHEPSATDNEFQMFNVSRGSPYYATAVVRGRNLVFGYREWRGSHTEKPMNLMVDTPGYYSVAIRIKEVDHLSMLYNTTEQGAIYQKEISTFKWQLRIKGGDHYLLSLHLSDEIEANTNFPATHYDQGYFLSEDPQTSSSAPVLSVGSYWIMRCIVRDPTKPLEVYMILNEPQRFVDKVEYSLSKVTQMEIITIHIESTRGSWTITTNFDGQTRRIDNTASPYQHWIHPFVSPNCEVVTQHVEQGGRRYP